MQQRKTPEDYFIEDQNKPHPEPMPRAIARQPEPDRFDEPETDWFWFGAYWMVGIVIGLMGACALKDMFADKYSWLLALSWTSTAVMGLAGLALIQKYWIRR